MIPMIIGMTLMSSMMTTETKKMKDEYYAGLSDLSSQTVEYVRGIPVVKTFAQSVESFDKLYSLIIKVKDNVLKLTMSYTNKCRGLKPFLHRRHFSWYLWHYS